MLRGPGDIQRTAVDGTVASDHLAPWSCDLASRLYRSNDPFHGELCLSIRVRVAKRMAGNMITQINAE
jgi:hypothetical protein